MDFKQIFTKRNLITVAFAIAAAVVASGITDYKASLKITKLENQLEERAMDYTAMKTERDFARSEYQKLESKLANLKTQEDLMKRDLYAYIKAKYRTVPNVVAQEIADQTVALSKKHNAPFPIVVGIMEVESHFNPMAISSAGARGLMQVMPFWADKMDFVKDKHDFHNIGTGIEAGIVAFNEHLKEANNNIAKGLYYYVGKDHTYKNKVFSAMGEFVAFRATVDDENVDAVHTEVNGNGKDKH